MESVRTVLSLAAAAVLVVSASAQAALITSFEDISGLQHDGDGTWVQSNIGVTDGTYSLALTRNTGGWSNTIKFSISLPAVQSPNAYLSIDATFPVGSPALSLSPALNFQNGGMQFMDSWTLIADGLTHTYTSPLPGPIPASGWAQIALRSTSGGAPVTAYLDNLQTVTSVPEPASMALLSLGGISLLRRRRR